MTYKRPAVRQDQYRRIIPIDNANPEEVKHYIDLMKSNEAYMAECDEIDEFWEQHTPKLFTDIGTEIKEVYNNAKKRWNQFEEAYPRAATGIKIGACVVGAALLIGAVKNLADVVDNDDAGSNDYLNTADDHEDDIMHSRADVPAPEYNIEQITNNTANDIMPQADSTGTYWLEDNGYIYDLWHEDNDGNEKEIATGLDSKYYDIDNGNIVTVDNGNVVVINNDGERTEIALGQTGYTLYGARISGDQVIYIARNMDDKETLYINNLEGTDEHVIATGYIAAPEINGDIITYSKAENDGAPFNGHVYKISSEEINDFGNTEYVMGTRVHDGKAVFLGSDDGENWAAYLQEDIDNPDSVIKIKDVASLSTVLSFGDKKVIIDENGALDTIYDLETKEYVEWEDYVANGWGTQGENVIFSKSDGEDNEIYKTDLSIKEPEPIEPVNNAPEFKSLPEGGKINGVGLEILVEDPDGDHVTVETTTPNFDVKDNKELVYVGNYPENDTPAEVYLKATDSKGASTETSLNVIVEGDGIDDDIEDPDPYNPNPNPNPEPKDNQSQSSGGLGIKEYGIIGAAGATLVTAIAGGAAVIKKKMKKKK